MILIYFFISVCLSVCRDERHIDFAEQVESVAYVLCGDGPLDLHRFYQLFQAKGVRVSTS